MSRSHQSNATLMSAAAAASLSAAVVAAILCYSSFEDIPLSKWILTPEQLARCRAARYRRRRPATIPACATKEQAVGPEKIQGLVEEIFLKKSNEKNRANDTTPAAAAGLLRIDRIEQDPDGEYVLWLIRSSTGEAICAPLLPFCRAVASRQQIYTYTLCFLYDATGGQDDIVTNLLQADPSVVVTTSSLSSRPPFWMKQWSTGLHVVLSKKEHKDLILQSLIRVEAALLIAAKPTPTTAKSIVFPIATEYASVLMPALQFLFPDDKHIFLYTGCIQAGAAKNRAITTSPLKPLVSIHMRDTKEFHAGMAKLPSAVAAAVECWMAAVDQLILLQDDFLANGFLPYVCRLDNLLLCAEKNETERKWAVRSLLQYCAASDKHVDAAIQTLPTLPTTTTTSPRYYANEIDAIVFCHKRILLAHKTMPDTVPPVEHWALKQQGGTGGCACCMEEDEETKEERLQIEQKVEAIMARSSTFLSSSTNNNASSYVDGKLGFAFDPSRFV